MCCEKRMSREVRVLVGVSMKIATIFYFPGTFYTFFYRLSDLY